MASNSDDNLSFKDLGVNEELCEACEKMGWRKPTPIQKECIPFALQGRDIIALAETGSGKTAAFTIPIIQSLMTDIKRMYALILTPTRELALQIKTQFDGLGKSLGLSCCTVVGGLNMITQTAMLSKRPYVIVATPGRLANHLTNTPSFKLSDIKFLVFDEADCILNLGFEEEVNHILKALPKERRTLLFSATMTTKVVKLQRAHVRNPVKIEVSTRYTTPGKLQQKMLFIPFNLKLVYLNHVMRQVGSSCALVFCRTCHGALVTALALRNLGINSTAIHSKMSQSLRLESLERFKSQKCNVLVGTDVVARGLDIPNVDYVINFDLPDKSKEYVHRVGRTARAGKSGTSITFVTQYEIEMFQRLEHVLELKMDVFPVDESAAMGSKEAVFSAEREAKAEKKNIMKPEKTKKRTLRELGDDNDKQNSFSYNEPKRIKKYIKKRR